MARDSWQGRYARWAAVALWAAVIFVFSSAPGSRVPGRLGPLAHFVEYQVLAVLILRALAPARETLQAAAWAVALASAYGITDELHQYFVPQRVSDPIDWLIDTAGAIVGVVLWMALMRVLRRTAATD